MFLLVGCGGGVGTSDGDSPMAAPASGGRELESGALDSESEEPLERQITREAFITLRVDNVAEAAASIRLLAVELKGRVSWEEINDSSGRFGAYSTITLAVPSSKLDQALDSLAEMGTVQTRSISATDVTEEVVDVNSRIATMRESIDRLNALMKKSGSVADIAAIEGELTKRQAELDSLLTRQKYLTGRVEMSPITVTLVPKGAEYSQPNPFVEGLQQGWAAFTGSITVLIALIGAVLPFAVVALLIALPLVRWQRKRAASRPKPKPVVPQQPWPGAVPPQQWPPATPPQQTDAPIESQPEATVEETDD